MVGVHVGRDPEALGTRLLHAPDHVPQLVPIVPARGLEVVDLGRDTGLAGNRNQLLDVLEESVSLTPDVADVHAAVLPGDFREGDQLVRSGVERGRVDQRRPDAQRPFLHCPPHEAAHFLELCLCRRPVLVAEHVDANGGRPDERGDVRGHSTASEPLQVLSERRPLDRVADVALGLELPFLHGLAERSHRRSLAEHLQGHTLPDVALSETVLDQRLIGPREHVDEARRHGEARRVDLGRAHRAPQVSDRGDPVALDPDVTLIGRPAGSVVDRAVPDDDVVFLRRSAGRDCKQNDRRGGDEPVHVYPPPVPEPLRRPRAPSSR